MRIALLFFLTFGVLPLAAGLLYALLYSLGWVGALAKGFSLEAWSATLTNSTFWIAMGISILIATTAICLSSAIALILLLRMRPFLERLTVYFMLHFPLALPPIVAAFLSFQWLGGSGLLARATYKAGWIGSPEDFPALINDPGYVGVIATMTLSTFPFLLLVFLQQYKAANLAQISDLAATLGANARQLQRRVLIPMLLQRSAPTMLLYGVFLFGAYELPLLLGRQNPAMISMFIHQKFRRFNLDDFPTAYVATVLYAFMVMVVVVFSLQKNRTLSKRMSG